MSIIDKFYKLIEQKNPLHFKYLSTVVFNEDDKLEFINLLNFYENNGITLDYQVKSYLKLVDDIIIETQYFMEHNKYRYSKLEEVIHNVYLNEEFMKQYMIGVAISAYTWNIHLNIRKYFTNYIKNLNLEGKYLEIGPGHGALFTKAIKYSKFSNFTGVDLSPTSCEMTKNMVYNQVNEEINKCNFICMDFLKHPFNEQYDFIVAGEVIEHVETPELFLNKVRDILTDNGEFLATIPINAPAVDHIYLYSHPDQIFKMIENSNLKIKDVQYFMANNYSFEKALKNRHAIDMLVILSK